MGEIGQIKPIGSNTFEFEKNVFINCPFDQNYYIPLLRPLLFTIISLRFQPRIATESFDSLEIRLQKIVRLIEESKFSIHDLSRLQSREKHELFRLNMAFELGIDIGCRLFKEGKERSKRCLVLETEHYRIKQALSDLSGTDIKHHNNNPEKLVREVRNWFVENGLKKVPSGTVLWENFNEFMAEFYFRRQQEGYKAKDLEMMPVPEFIDFIKAWTSETLQRFTE